MRTKINVMIIALLLIVQSFFSVTLAYADAPAPELPQSAVSDPNHTVTDAVYVAPNLEPPREIPSNTVPFVQGATSSKSQHDAAPQSILTKLSLTDEAGRVIDAVYSPDSQFDIGSAIQLGYEWELPDNTYKSGDTFTFHLPEQFIIYTDISSPLVTTDGTVGYFTVDRQGKVIMTFNQYVENHSNVSGKLQIKTEFTKETVKGSTEIIIAIPIKGGVQTVIVNVKPQSGPTLSKQGKIAGTNQIDWTIDVNKQLNTVKHALITDPIPSGLELRRDSIRLYHLQVNIDGSTVVRDLVNASEYAIEADQAGTGFVIHFQDDSINTAYQIQYSTRIIGDETRFSNTATLSGDTIENVIATATVQVERGEFLSKKVEKYDHATQTLSWAIRYNFSETKIPEAKALLIDHFNKTQELLPGSLKVFKGNTLEELPSWAYTVIPVDYPDRNGFKLQFNFDVDSAYTIRYQTQARGRVYENEKVTNIITSDGTQKIVSTEIISGVMTKMYDTPNYNTKIIPWVITINTDLYTMKNIVIQDMFPNGGLALLPDTLKIQSVDGTTELRAPTDYELIPLSQDYKQGFTLIFHKAIQEAYTIKYSTTYNNDWKTDTTKPEFRNKSHIEYQFEDGERSSQEVECPIWPDFMTQRNGAKQGSYNATSKLITWDIKANYNRKILNHAEVRDPLLQGQKLLPASVKVYDMTLLGWWDGVQKGAEIPADQYTIIPPSEQNGNELRIQFKNKIQTPYWITFQTSLEGELIEKEIHNQALLLDGQKTVSEWTAQVTLPHGGEYVSKVGTQNGNKIDWSIRINEGQSHVSNAKIIDQPSSNQILIEDSFHLYSTIIAANGNTTKGTELIRNQDYKLYIKTDAQGQQTFELTFAKDISTAFILEYQSFIHAEDKAKVSNKVAFEGDRLTTELRETSQEIIVRTSSGSGSGGGVTESLELTKVDQDMPDKVLPGAQFALYDKGQKRAPLIQTTNQEGKIIFSSLLHDDYILEELAAPEGYKITEGKLEIKIDATLRQSSGVKRVVITNRKEKKNDPEPPVDPGTPTDPTNPSGPGTPTHPNPSPPSGGSGKKHDKDPEIPDIPSIIVPPSLPKSPEDIVSPQEEPAPIPPELPAVMPHQDPPPPVDSKDDPEPKIRLKVPGKEPEEPENTPAVHQLPQTGESSPVPFYLTGIAMVIWGVFLKFRRTNKK
ncbi:LPXTG cell wall anchor domain-containing protein [Paenibacillus sp. EKM212P]|uniref:LPXTG cell wall anchor domain-containing protein n=1 Tax=Paenibacillus sp. EKM212P TaxID=1683680 RepID=UPI0013EA136E|nr:LPXTG cell wall anchor domain-containing protein [Paenibacillus sp. EKM212P]KAF6577623.1 LPXTG cell wall anchor domain-containing protein [Paenibacillus sp. EKM212P]